MLPVERNFYLSKLKNIMGTPDIKVIKGIRRSGKSLLVFNLVHVTEESNLQI